MSRFGKPTSKSAPDKSLKVNDGGSLPGGLSSFTRFQGLAGFANLTGIPVGDMIPKNLLLVMGLGIGGIMILISRKAKHGCLLSRDCKAFSQQFSLSLPNPKSNEQPRALKNLKFAVKDTFDVECYITGFGCPEWTRTHDAATRHAIPIVVLMQADATCIGKTVMDEMGFSMDGQVNQNYGRLVNPAAPDYIVGGSSGGSAVAVAAGLCDFSLGMDTLGDVRLPAACCGVLGFRATHGSVSTVGVLPVAQSFDTVGWFAKDPSVLRQVGLVLLQFPLREDLRAPRRIYIADDLFKNSAFLTEHSLDVLLRAIVKVFGRQVLHHINLGEMLTDKLPTIKAFSNVEERLGDAGGSEAYSVIRDCMLMLYRDEFLKNHHDWLDKTKPRLGKGISGKVRASYELTSSTHLVPTAKRVREEVRAAFADLLKHETVIVLPSIAGAPPRIKAEHGAHEKFFQDTSMLMCLSSMSGGPQVTVPTGEVDGCPMSVSILTKANGDRLLLETVLYLYPAIELDKQTDLKTVRI
ncbi:hypothetical protein R1sor_015940 [Riccia sorocarpa]|uniref:Amidase domain-containing protein n=1 Tax=Riccia sorocarpa TaxID=122646 RepID=A0ABD3HFK1_9MARC